MKISLLILLGLTLAFMVQTGEARKRGTCKVYGRTLDGNHRGTWDRAGNVKEECDCPYLGGEASCRFVKKDD
jgi:hypothetical protein